VQVGPESVGASEGFLGWVAYLGAANAGIPLSIIVKNYGWEVLFPCLSFLCHCMNFVLYAVGFCDIIITDGVALNENS
jgi:sugar phosphate permease